MATTGDQETPPPPPATVDQSAGPVRVRIIAKSRVFPLDAEGRVDRAGVYWWFKHTHERDAYPHKRGYAFPMPTQSDGVRWVQVDDDDARRVRVRKPGERGCYLAYAGCDKPARRGSYFCSEKHAAQWGEQMVRDEAMYHFIEEDEDEDGEQTSGDVTVWCIEHERYITTPYSHLMVWDEHHLLGVDGKPWQPAAPQSENAEDQGEGDGDE